MNEIKRRSRRVLEVDIISLSIFFLIMFFVREKFAQIFKEMNVPTTLFYEMFVGAHPAVLIAEFIIIIAILILKEGLIRNKSVTFFINSIILIVLVLPILFFGYSAFFLPLYPIITELPGPSIIDNFGYLVNINMVILVGIFIVGLFIFFKPISTIEFQRRFYEKINWRMEPISMEKEIRNTRIMGLFLVGVSLATVIYSLFIKK